MGSRLTINTRNLILHLKSLGYPINDTNVATPLYNDNEACVKWCHNLTTKGNRHFEDRENVTREWVEDGSISVSHVNGKCNPSDIITKEMRDSANFRRLWDSLCHGLPTSSVEYSILSTLCQPLLLLLNMLLNMPVMSHPRAQSYLTSSFPNLCFTRQFLNHA